MVKESDIVAKHNDLIPAMAKMSLQELRFLAFSVALLDSRAGQEFHEIEAKVSDLADIYSMTNKDAYGIVRRVAISINQHPAEWEDGDAQYLSFWLQSFIYRAGTFRFRFSDMLVPKLLGLTENFTRYRLKDVYQFTSANTWRLYEVLRQWKAAGGVRWYLDELRSKVGVAGKYPKYGDLDRRVIHPGVDEINKFSDIKVQYQRVLHGRKEVAGVEFFIIDNPDTKSPGEQIRDTLKQTFDVDQLDAAPEIRKRLVAEFKFSHDEARHLANRCAKCQPEASKLLDKLLERHKAGQVNGPLVGYIVGAVDGWLTAREDA